MNILNYMKIKKGKIKTKKEKDKLVISNLSTTKRGYVFFLKPIHTKGSNVKLKINYSVTKGENPQFKLVNRHLKVVERIGDPSTTYYEKINRLFFVCVALEPNSIIELEEVCVDIENKQETFEKENQGDILLIVPGYPSKSNKYSYAFVHTRVLEYKKKKWNVDVRVVNANFIDKTVFYNYEGVNVIETGFGEIRTLLQTKKYDKIFVHFFSDAYAQILDASNTLDTDIYIFTHGSDILYRDANILTNKYFKKVKEISEKQEKQFKEKDRLVKRYNEMPNVKFFFPSNWAKKRAEEENKIKFNNAEVLPTFIDEKQFPYNEKDESLRKKILIIRKYDNYSTYSIDLAVKAIEELSNKEFFNELEFSFYGDGEYHDKLLSPLKKYKNVKIYKKFLSHDEIAEVQKENGIALFATRYETQGVSAAEAAVGGLVVVSNNTAAVPEMFNKKYNILAEEEDYKGLASIIERLYNNPKEFTKLSKELHNDIKKNYGYDSTIKKEMAILDKKLDRKKYSFNKISKDKVLTISIAAYNVERYLHNSVQSLIESDLADKLEILIVNDGSKDNTAEIGKELEKLTTVNKDSIVKFINKENGGHGSTINKGIELATGKYFKVMDGDDYFDTEALTELIKYLEKSDEDIILNNYVEDQSVYGYKRPIRHYKFMEPGKTYKIETLCKGGFKEWGPLLSTSTFKTEMLKKANFKISEHCFYVDMELNAIAFSKAKTVKYYPLDLYIYYLGRQGQSVSAASFKRNYKNHEHVTLRIIKDVYYNEDLSEPKKYYLKNKIIYPLIKGQYYITTEHFDNGKQFIEFDSQLKEYPEFYKAKEIIDSRVRIYRFTKGHFMKVIKGLVKVKNTILRRQ